jgi:hypothetical protein
VAPSRRPAIIARDGADRGRVDLPIFGTGQRDLADTAQGSPLERPCHCLEGTGSAVRPLPSAHCERQEDPCRGNGDRPRTLRLLVGDRSSGCAPGRSLKKLRRCLHHGNLIVAWRALSPSIPRAKGRDPGGRWGLTAPRGQAEVRCQMMNANLAQGFHLTSPHGEAPTSVEHRTI